MSLEIRIKKIQKKLDVSQTGIFDLATCNALELALQNSVSDLILLEKKKNIQRKLGFTGNGVDGIFGVNTTTKIEFFLDERLPELPVGASMIVSKNSLEIILESEVSSRSVYMSKYRFPIWPQAESGVTIGIGYDLGYATATVFEADWGSVLSSAKMTKLKKVLGKKGNAAKQALTNEIKQVEVPLEAALEVFYTRSMPKYAKTTATAYPGIALLPPDAQGALLSLVYNRGASLDGDRRREMKNIQKWVTSKNLSKIAAEIRSMKRLWPDLRGLIIRREREAKLVENAKYFVKPQDYIFV